VTINQPKDDMETKREVRRVPMEWKHPIVRNLHGRDEFVPLFGLSFREQCEQVGREYSQSGCVEAARTQESEHFPDWPESVKIAWQMYETETAGTPISPVFATADALVDWLVAGKVGYFAGHPGTREDWERVVGLAPLETCDSQC
jgi:hypothetical protein